MKKLSKILLSICMAFIVSFSFIACAPNDDNNNGDGGNGGSSTYTPPTGVDMTSMTDYTKWLLDNPDLNSSYIGTIYEKEGTTTKTTLIKYQYKNNTQCIAVYSSSNTLESYYEIEEITSTSCIIKSYDISTLTYTETVETNSEAQKRRANLFCADAVVMLPYQTEINQGFEIGTDITTLPGYSGYTVNETVTNPATGEYDLSRILSVTQSGVSSTISYTSKIIRNRTQSFRLEYSALKFMELSYDYKDVTINFDKTLYTKVS